MRRKLIKQDAFDRIIAESVTTAERELVESEPILARAMGKDFLRLKSFTESTVLYDTLNGTYVHAGYEIKNGQVTFSNMAELVIDESSQTEKRKSLLSEMIDAVLVDNTAKAHEQFSNYLGMVRWNEAKSHEKKEKGGFPFGKKNEKKHDADKKDELFKKAKKSDKGMAEAYITSQNVLDYVDFMKVGPSLAEAVTKVDDKGNLTDIRIPARQLRNESKLQRFDWKTLNAKAADSRKKIPYFSESQEFCKAIANVKRQNSFSDNQGLEEALDHVVRNWPEVIYATQPELAQVISEALVTVNVNNFDDQACEFMAEGILRRAHGAYSEKVAQILHLASAPKMQEGADPYAHFQSIVENFYPALDEKFGLERKVFSDLYESLALVYKKAERQGDNALKSEAASYLNELATVLQGEARPELDLVEDAAGFLTTIIETNLESGKWVVSNTPHLTVNGDHPDMSKKASHGYAPSKDFSGDWGDPLPAVSQDAKGYKGKNAKEMRHNSWGQEGGSEVFPKLSNPYVPKAFGDYTMKAEKGVDKSNQDHSLWSSGDTWPNLKNPYVPKEVVGTGGKGYKMNKGKEADLVVDK